MFLKHRVCNVNFNLPSSFIIEREQTDVQTDGVCKYGGCVIFQMVLHYYLADDTVEVREVFPANAGRDTAPTFLRRGRLPKTVEPLKRPGETADRTVLDSLKVCYINYCRGRYRGNVGARVPPAGEFRKLCRNFELNHLHDDFFIIL